MVKKLIRIGRPPKPRGQRLSRGMNFWVTEKQHRKIHAAAEKRGVRTAEMMRSAVLREIGEKE